jgi:L-arabinose isomerase
MTIESFEVSKDETFGDLLNDYEKKKTVKVGVYTSGYFEYWRMYPGTLEAFVRKDLDVVMGKLRAHLGPSTEIVWPGLVSTLDEADRAGRLFKKENVDVVVFVAFTYTVDVISLQCLRYVEKVPLVIFLRQSHRDIDFRSNYEQTLRNSAMIAASQLTGTFRKMGIFPSFEVFVGADFEDPPYREMRKYIDAVGTWHYLRELNVGIIGHVFRGMFDHEFDRTSITGSLGPQVIDIQVSHLLDLWEKVTDAEAAECARELGWVRRFTFQKVTEEEFLRECRFTVAYKRLIKRFRLDAVCFLGQHYVEVKTGCTGYLASVVLAKEKQYMANTEGDVNGLIMMCIMNKLTGQAPLFGEWGEYGEKENAMQMMMHGYGDPDLAKGPQHVKITGTPENWGHQGSGLSVEYTAKPGPVTIGHLIDDKNGWRMLIGKGEAIDAEQSIPCEDVTLLFRPDMPIKEFVRKILKTGFDHHAIICYGDVTQEMGYLADLMGVKKDYV